MTNKKLNDTVSNAIEFFEAQLDINSELIIAIPEYRTEEIEEIEAESEIFKKAIESLQTQIPTKLSAIAKKSLREEMKLKELKIKVEELNILLDKVLLMSQDLLN